MDYKKSGVDIDAGNEVVRRIRSLARGTFTPGVLSEIGSFGGLFQLGTVGGDDPVLVASADGVGTKLRLAFMTGVHTTIGVDLVNHCTNDILVQGAQPLFFLDYLATGRLDPDVAVQIVEGLATACRDNGCALLGGETAEMPDFYPEGEYDLAGFIVGIVDKSKVIDGRSIEPGDVVLGLPSTGLQTNGYSLARKLFFDVAGYAPDTVLPELQMSVGQALLQAHLSYLRPLDSLLDTGVIKGLAHITGGGLTDNIPRILPEGTAVRIQKRSWPVLPIYELMREIGNVSDAEMYRTFNMGVGMVIVCSPENRDSIKSQLEANGDTCYEIGEVVSGDKSVTIE